MRFGIRELVFVALLVVMPVLVWLWPLQKINDKIAEIRTEVSGWQGKLQQLETALKRDADLDAEIDKLTKAIDLFEQKLPSQREEQVILKEVWELAAKNQLKPQRVQTDKQVVTATYAELPIRLTISGDFDGFYNFILALEKLPRITCTPKMKLIKTPNAEGHMSAEMVMSIFFDSDQAEKTKS